MKINTKFLKLGAADLFSGVFLRKLKNRSGSISVQIIEKINRSNKVVKTIGCGKSAQQIERLVAMGRQEIERLQGQSQLFVSPSDAVIESAIDQLSNASIRTIGPELIYGSLFDHIGFGNIKEELFRHIVIARLAFPLSKLKTIEYLYRYQGVHINIDSIYRFLDKLNSQLKDKIEQIAFEHTKKLLGGKLSIVFYDMTTLYFEASEEDDLRKTGFSKDGKHSHPQIYLGLLVGLQGYAIGYDIFEGNTYEGHTLIPFLEKMSNRFDLGKPIVIADSALLSNKNLQALEDQKYEYIIGARIKNESKAVKKQITSQQWEDGQVRQITRNAQRLIVCYSSKRASKDAHNRKRGLQRLEKRLRSGKLTKSNINNKGYNKYLKMTGKVDIEIDYHKFDQDVVWDGLKGYITNSKLSKKQIIDNYHQLWQIEKAFRISKTDLRIRPVYHRLVHRIQAHICISFVAYCIYMEMDRLLKKQKSDISIKKAHEITHNMYQITFQLPESKHFKSTTLKMDDQQAELYQIIQKNCWVLQK